jgi:hypothetical protein
MGGSVIIRIIAACIWVSAAGIIAVYWLPKTEHIAIAGVLAALGGVLWASAEQVKNREIERSRFYLESAMKAVEQAQAMLEDHNNDRVTWIAAARILERAVFVARSITAKQHKRIWEIAREAHRRTFADFLGYANPAYAPAAFFYGVLGYQNLNLDDAARESSRPAGPTNPVRISDARMVDEASLYTIWQFCEYSEDYDDPLPSRRFSEAELRRAERSFHGLGHYLRHRRRYSTIGGNLVEKDSEQSSTAGRLPPPQVEQSESSMANQLEVRAQIDTETVKALLLLNGGGAIALLSLFAAILGKTGYEKLPPIVLHGVLVFMFGLFCAVVHNRLRRICSLHYQAHGMRPPAGRLLGINLGEPTVCAVSIWFMWLSLLAFLGAGVYVAVRAIVILG